MNLRESIVKTVRAAKSGAYRARQREQACQVKAGKALAVARECMNARDVHCHNQGMRLAAEYGRAVHGRRPNLEGCRVHAATQSRLARSCPLAIAHQGTFSAPYRKHT